MVLSRRRFAVAAGAVLAAPALIRPARAARVFVDSAGRRVAVPDTVRRVFAAGPPATILLFALAPDTLLGWSRTFHPAERDFVPQKYADLPELGRLTGRGNTANVEVILTAKPDVIFDYGTINPTYVSLADRVQEQTGVPYVLIDGAFGAMDTAITRMGELLAAPAVASELAAYVRGTLATIDEVLAKRPAARRPRVYYGRGPRGIDTALGGSITVESLERVGAVNVAAEALGRGGIATVSLEQILAWNPDTIVTLDENFHRLAREDVNWRGVRAVREGRVYLAPRLPFGWIDFPPAMNRLIGLHWLAKVLYPDLYAGDLTSETREFYRRFYHRTPTDAQIAQLLGPSLAR